MARYPYTSLDELIAKDSIEIIFIKLGDDFQ